MKTSLCFGGSVLHCKCDPPPLFKLPKPPGIDSGHSWQAFIIAAIVVSSILLLAVITVLTIVIIRKRKPKDKDGNRKFHDRNGIIPIRMTASNSRNDSVNMENPVYSDIVDSAPGQNSTDLSVEDLDSPHQVYTYPKMVSTDGSGKGRQNQEGPKRSTTNNSPVKAYQLGSSGGGEQNKMLWRKNWQLQHRDANM